MSGNRGHEMLEEPFEMSGFETGYQKGKEDMRAEIIEKIIGIQESGEDKTPYDQPQPRAYNKALKDVINIINNK